MKHTTKIYDKKYKTAELKIIKILNKIETFKLDNSYFSQLEVSNKRKPYNFDVQFLKDILKDKIHFVTVLLIILLCLISGLWWKYNELQGKVCSIGIIVDVRTYSL